MNKSLKQRILREYGYESVQGINIKQEAMEREAQPEDLSRPQARDLSLQGQGQQRWPKSASSSPTSTVPNPLSSMTQAEVDLACSRFSERAGKLRAKITELHEKARAEKRARYEAQKQALARSCKTKKLTRNSTGQHRIRRRIKAILDHRKIKGELKFRSVWEGLEDTAMWEKWNDIRGRNKNELVEYITNLSKRRLDALRKNYKCLGSLIQ